jgi:hypothetical protein
MQIKGRAYFSHGQPADGVKLRIYHIWFNGGETLLDEVVTTADGSYATVVSPPTEPMNLEVRTPVGLRGEGHVALTRVHCRSETVETVLNIVVPSTVRPMGSEFDRLRSDLSRYLGEEGRLGDAQEDTEVRNLSLLHCSTQWDARLIALAAKADRMTADSGIDPQAVYGLCAPACPVTRSSSPGSASPPSPRRLTRRTPPV